MRTTISPPMSQAEHELWRDLLRRRFGLDFPESRLVFLTRRLQERMLRLGLGNFTEYYHRVTAELRGNQGTPELDAILELLLNHQSEFFRHNASYEALTRRILPELLAAKRAQGIHQVSFWSAGCSAGQEAYSIAMSACELPVPHDHPIHFHVLGTDIGRNILAKAAEGKYSDRELGHIREDYRRRYLTVERSGPLPTYRVVERIRSMVQFDYLNLASTEEYWVPPQDVIFCQNVLIYFDTEDRKRVVERLYQKLKPGGSLILGPAEFVGIDRPGLRAVALDGIFILQRAS